jgi:SH3-like domain-containing protein
MSKKITLKLLVFCVLAVFSVPATAQDDSESSAFRSTTYPLPRFVSLASNEIYVRTGPGQRYPIKLVYKKKDLPVEVILEYEAWRKIRDQEGDIGWVHKSLLSGKRTGIIKADDVVSAYRKPSTEARLVAYIEPATLGSVKSCEDAWCEFESAGYSGWVQRQYIWGVYEGENFN